MMLMEIGGAKLGKEKWFARWTVSEMQFSFIFYSVAKHINRLLISNILKRCSSSFWSKTREHQRNRHSLVTSLIDDEYLASFRWRRRIRWLMPIHTFHCFQWRGDYCASMYALIVNCNRMDREIKRLLNSLLAQLMLASSSSPRYVLQLNFATEIHSANAQETVPESVKNANEEIDQHEATRVKRENSIQRVFEAFCTQ